MDDIFEREMQKQTVFLDRNVLSPHYIPEILPHREKEIEHIMKTLAPALNSKTPNNLFVYGKSGTGKTASIKHVIDKLLQVKEKYKANVDSVYVNCRNLDSKYQVVLKCAEYCFPNESFNGYPFAHLYDRMLRYVKDSNSNFIVVLDELDAVKNLDGLMYALTRANDELSAGHITIIGITNDAAFKQDLDSRSRSTLCEEEMVFPPYNAVQLQSILKQRASLGFREGVVDESAISLASALAAQESGDARYALKLILKAGEIADEQKNEKITDKHVSLARKGVEEEIVYEVIHQLPEGEKIVLYAIALLTAEGSHYARLDGVADEKVLFSGEVYERYEALCRKLEKDARSARWCREYINDLETQGLVITTLSGKGIRGNTTLTRLAFPADKVKTAIERHFKE
jgi:cell division control protein 6